MLFFPPRLAPKVRARSAASTSSGTVRPSQGKLDRKSTRLNSSHSQISYAVFCLKKKNKSSHTAASRVTHQQPLIFRLDAFGWGVAKRFCRTRHVLQQHCQLSRTTAQRHTAVLAL